MKRYFDYFKTPFIIAGIVIALCLTIIISNSGKKWNNNATDLDHSVFDFADNLTAEQEAKLEKLIAKAEKKAHTDIAVVILNESLEEAYNGSNGIGMGDYDIEVRHYYVKGYADAFADVHNMGYEKPLGSNVVFVDNCYREPSTGRVDSWMSTYGDAKVKLSSEDCDSIMDIGLENLTDYSTSDDYFAAYSKIVKLIPSYMTPIGGAMNFFTPLTILIVSLVISAFYIMGNWKSKLGKVTTTSTTYVENGTPNMTRREDRFIRKSVTKRKIETNSGGGGGGFSGGGGGHGGGGHSR